MPKVSVILPFFNRAATLARCVESVRRQTNSGALTVREEPNLPDVLVDRLQIELVLRNLIANAAEAVEGPAGAIGLSAQRHDPKHVRIVVTDNGPGIPSASLQRVFEPFVSGKPTGMGLGLAVSRAIAEAHGGTLDAVPGPRGELRLVLPAEAGHG